ncbi:hypothetical protein BGZ46_001474 [Entomortierella lignicola]|nr:hypothetical protein BGZ46_001474 [Entomortierella lignicola]
MKHLCTDLPTLHKLLFVNKFFFHATLPHLYHNPIITWEMNSASPKYHTDPNKLFALFFVSFLQTRLKELQWSSGDDREADLILDGILKQFGLKLNLPFQFSGHDMLNSIASNLIRIHLNGNNHSNHRLNLPPNITVDYSKFLRNLRFDSWGRFQFYSMVRLRKLSKYEPENDSNPSNNTPATEEDDDDEQHIVAKQRTQYYIMLLRHALTEMWLHYNFDSVTSFHFDATKAQKYLPLSKKLASIQLIYLSRKREMPCDCLENTILFIKQNQETFPQKSTLDVQFSSDWFIYDEDFIDESDLTDLSSFISWRNNYREQSSRYTKPVVSIYKAIQKPSMLTATRIPNFYEHVKDMELLRLKKFEDNCLDRTKYDEAPQREDFFRRCENLRDLQLGVDNHKIFSWAVDEAKDSKSLSTGRPLGNLETLNLWTDRSYSLAIQAFNDAMFAFSKTLQSISLNVDLDYDKDSIPIEIRNARTMEAILLHQRPTAISIGDWPCILPCLRTINIRLDDVASIKVGSLNRCPNLESLGFRYGFTSQADNQGRPEGIAPTAFPESGGLLDPRWAQVEMDCTLFPTWSLLRLKRLDLGGMAAMKFDVRSNMPRLESLTLDTRREKLYGANLDSYISYQYCDSSEQPPISSDYKQGRTNGTLDFGSTGAMERPRPYLHLFPIWSLPRLTYLELWGISALKFNFHSLAGMQSLCTLKLDTQKETLLAQELDDYIARQHGISNSQLYNETIHEPRLINGIFDSDVTKIWRLPELKSLYLNGVPSSLFYLDLLKSFPKLESLILDGTDGKREVSRYSLFRSNSEAYQSHRQQDALDKETNFRDHGHSKAAGDNIYLDSRLKRFTILGNWTMSRQDITSLLTIYAPFLEKLNLKGLGDEDSQEAKELIGAIKDADDINLAYSEVENNNGSELLALKSSQRSIPGRNLKLISTALAISDEDQKKLGLRKIKYEEMRVFDHYGIRQYLSKHFIFVQQEDFDLVMNT